jgi:hypothetical protein
MYPRPQRDAALKNNNSLAHWWHWRGHMPSSFSSPGGSQLRPGGNSSRHKDAPELDVSDKKTRS